MHYFRFKNRKAKITVHAIGKQLTGTGMYPNEHLPATHAELVKTARLLIKLNKHQEQLLQQCSL